MKLNLIGSALTVLMASASSFASPMALEDLGGSGVKTYDGVNRKAWVYKQCKVIIAGTSKTPVTYISIEDSENAYIYWTYSKTFTSGSGYDSLSVTASDNMNLVADSNGSTQGSKTYSNVSKAGGGGISSAIFKVSESSGNLLQVEFNYFGQPKNSEILCADLQLRK